MPRRALIARLVPLLCPARPHPALPLPAFRSSRAPWPTPIRASTSKILPRPRATAGGTMGEFSDDDDDFATFDLDSAVSAARRTSAGNNPYGKAAGGGPAPAFRDPNLGGGPSANDDGGRNPRAHGGGNGGGSAKRLKTDGPSAPPPSAPSPAGAPEGEEGDIPASFRGEMERSLAAHFGHGTFRPGQLAVLHALLGGGDGGGRDACVFWATGAGKSLCYQLPPLHLNRTAVVVSPLISLMQDQVSKLNGRTGSPVATYLGSGQVDPDAESRALAGDYRLVYVTPEKLCQGGFAERLAGLHGSRPGGAICLFAVDESHCVSEWGHDFRPHFLEVGPTLRDDPVLSSVPILALTATAVPRVQADIARSLRLRPDAAVARKSFDRTNLRISVRRRPRNGVAGAFDPVASEVAAGIVSSAGTGGRPAPSRSTIVYCSTKREVDEVSAAIAASVVREVLSASPPGSFDRARAEDAASARVRAYHAGLPLAERHDAHTDFLVGRASVVVATVAFGMGIDKPDIRRVVHWGGCKTVEEYYQQIGRAGRDGLTADCIMYADTKDFVRYEDDFYLGRLGPEARAATMRSLGALREYAMDTTGCRRASLLEFFDETPSFGRHCGTCDLCLTRERHGDDLTRDFQNLGARVLLFAILAVPDQAMTTVKKVLGGGAVEGYRYARGLDGGRVSRKIDQLKGLMKKKRPVAYYEELLPSLVGGGYVSQSTRTATHQYARPYTVFSVTAKGRSAAVSGEIVLPVPQSVREQERLDEEKRLATLRDLESKGVSMDAIPQEEIDEGDGEAIRALKRWHSYVDSLSDRGLQDKVNAMDDLRGRIEGWRLDAAGRYRMAPGEVLQEHLLVSIAYAVANLAPGQVMTRESLIAAGVRSNGIDDLTSALGDWTDEYKAASPDGGKGDGASSPMRFDGDGAFVPSGPWRHSVYKPNKKTGKATWELSYDRFMGPQRDSPQTIAMTQPSGKPIQVSTVVSHLLTALTHGRKLDLSRLADSSAPPDRDEWDELERCTAETGLIVTDDPATSGVDGERFAMKDFLRPVMGDDFVRKDYKERTPEESARWTRWCGLLGWYMAMKRVGATASF